MGEVEIDFISFVPRGANRKKYFLVKQDRSLKEDILKSILMTEEGEVSRILKEAGLEGEAAEFLEGAAKLLKAYREVLPEGALQILAKACGLPAPEPKEKDDLLNGGERPKVDPAQALSKETIAKMDPANAFGATDSITLQSLPSSPGLFLDDKFYRPVAFMVALLLCRINACSCQRIPREKRNCRKA